MRIASRTRYARRLSGFVDSWDSRFARGTRCARETRSPCDLVGLRASPLVGVAAVPPSLKLRRTAEALAEAGRPRLEYQLKAEGPPPFDEPQGGPEALEARTAATLRGGVSRRVVGAPGGHDSYEPAEPASPYVAAKPPSLRAQRALPYHFTCTPSRTMRPCSTLAGRR